MDSAANGAIELHSAHEKALDIERNEKKVRWWGDKLSEMRFYGRIKENWQWMGNEMLHNDWSSVRICNYALTITLKILYEFFVKKTQLHRAAGAFVSLLLLHKKNPIEILSRASEIYNR